MTSASGLFYQRRRSRTGRHSDSFGVGPGSGSHLTPRRHRHSNSAASNQNLRDRLDPDGCNPLRRPSYHPRLTFLRRSSHLHQEREFVRHVEGSHHFSPGNVIHPEPEVDGRERLRFSGNDRLPGAVLLARERLLQRLRGVTLSDSRRSDRNSSGQRSDIGIRDDLRLVDAEDWETETSRVWLAAIAPIANSIGPHMSKRPPGLTQEALSCFPVEVFSVSERSDEQYESRPSRECSICLETFMVGDELIRLPCGHRYHFSCLDPWVRTCADCPYCRRSIDVPTSDRLEKNSEC